MTPNLLEVISLGVVGFLIIYGALSLCWSFLDRRKTVPSSQTK